MVNISLRQEIIQLEADFCSALSDPTRIFILYALDEGPCNVTELTREVGVPQPTVSRHLKVLRERGLVFAQRQGTVVIYHLADQRIIQALDLLRSVMRSRLTEKANLVSEPG
jgi:DNA-binding transcriptional ArsR family regulator